MSACNHTLGFFAWVVRDTKVPTVQLIVIPGTREELALDPLPEQGI